MPRDINDVTLRGYLGKDPVRKAMPNGTCVVNFGLATKKSWKDREGQWQEKTEWHQCKAFGKLAELIAGNCDKGTKLYLEGSIETRNWEDKDTGKRVYMTEVRVADAGMLVDWPKPTQRQEKPEQKRESWDRSDPREPEHPRRMTEPRDVPGVQMPGQQELGGGQGPGLEDEDDSLPF